MKLYYKLPVDEVTSKDLGGGLREITAVITNSRLMPTHSSQDLKYKIEVPDVIALSGLKVIAGMVVINRDMGITTEQRNDPANIRVSSIPGNGTVTVRWIVQGAGEPVIIVDSKKGGIATSSGARR